MFWTIRTPLAALLVWFVLVAEARACSVADTYMPPSDFEIIQSADAIVVATAIDGTTGSFDLGGKVRFRTERVIKGAPPTRFDTEGVTLIEEATDEIGEFSGGMCGRVAFTRNKTYVLFLSQTDNGDGWQESPYLFASTSTEYEGPDDQWLARINRYLDIQSRFEPMDQFAELDRVIAELQRLPKSDERDDEIRSLTEHVSARSPWKPTQYLIGTYEQLESGQRLRWPITEPDYGQAGGAKELPLETQKWRVLLSLVEGEHRQAASLFERLLAKPDASALELGYSIRFVATMGNDHRRALELIETRIAPRIEQLPVADAMGLISAASMSMSANVGNNDSQFWKSDAELMKRWPAIAFGFYRYIDTRLGSGWVSFFDEMEALDPGDFRAWPDWTLLEANHYNDDLTEWAIEELKNDKLRIGHEAALAAIDKDAFDPLPTDPALLPMRSLVRAWHDDRNPTLRSMFCLGETRRRLLISSLGSDAAPDEFDDDLFKAMLASPSLTLDDRNAIIAASADILGRAQAYSRSQGMHRNFGESRWVDLIKLAAGNDKPPAPPIICPAS